MSTTNDTTVQNHLNGHSAVILVVFVVVSFFVIWPVHIPLLGFVQRGLLKTLRATRVIDDETSDRLSHRRLRFPLSLETAPVIGVLLLLATTTIDGSTIRLGVKGDENVKPYDVLVLFISLAYIAIALDGTGALEAVAFWVSKKGGNSGPRLFAYLYAFFLFTGCIVGNDPLILSGTPFLAYLTKHTGLEPTAWIFSEFIAANTASAVLVSSNPTNILITGSFGLNYLTEFTKWTILPSVIPGLLNYLILYFMFRNRIPKTLTPLKEDAWSKLRDPKGALFLSVLMLVTIAVLVGTSFVPGHGVEVWMITAPAGLLAFAFEVVSDLRNPTRQLSIVKEEDLDPAAGQPQERSQSQASIAEMKSKFPPEPTIPNDSVPESQPQVQQTQIINEKPVTKSTDNPSSQPQLKPINSPTPHHQRPSSLTLSMILTHTIPQTLPRTSQTLQRLPIPLLPFAIAEFILVRGLSQRGWIHTFAVGFARACTTPTRTVFMIGFTSAAFLCPFAGTNIGATILLVEVIQDPSFRLSSHVQRDPRVLQGAIYAAAVGSNLGAFSFVFAASLAGLLWRALLRDKGVDVGMLRFLVVNLAPLVVGMGVACAILVGQLYWFL